MAKRISQEPTALGEKKHRVQLDFSTRTVSQLDDLVKKLDASSRAEVLRMALNLLDRKMGEGTTIMIKYKDSGTIETLRLIY